VCMRVFPSISGIQLLSTRDKQHTRKLSWKLQLWKIHYPSAVWVCVCGWVWGSVGKCDVLIIS